MSLSKEISIGVIYPSRGLLYTETLKELLHELKDYDYKIYWSHGNKLPACFNKPLTKALKASHSHILILEDDMVIKPGTLKRMFEYDVDVVACDYPIVEQPSGTALFDNNGVAIFTGTGFMLVKTEVFNAMEKPIFRSSVEWTFKQYGDKIRFKAGSTNPDEVYGHHDVLFGLYRYSIGKPIVVADIILSQRKLKTKGDSANNVGTDEIILYDNYKQINQYIYPDKEEIQSKLLKTVYMEDKEIHLMRDFADKLIKEGKAEEKVILTYGNIEIDLNRNKLAIKYFTKGNKNE